MWKKILKHLFLILNIAVAAGLGLAVAGFYISPVHAWLPAFFSFLFPFFLLLNLFFIIFWIIQRKKWFVLSLIMVLCSWEPLMACYQFPLFKTKKINKGYWISLMTYNVRVFNRYNWTKDPESGKKIIDFLVAKNTDVICLQEFYSSNKGNFSIQKICQAFSRYKYSFVHLIVTSASGNYGLAIFSKYPVVNRGVIRYPGTVNASIFVDIAVSRDTLRIYNNHLQSIHLLSSHYRMIDTLSLNYGDREIAQFKNIFSRFINASKKRAIQARLLKDHVKQCRFPVIVCGDFNDTPYSYTYQVVHRGLKDVFVESGIGSGGTYFGIFPSFRIDYIFHSKDLLAYRLKIFKLPFSDHYPMQCGFTWKPRYSN